MRFSYIIKVKGLCHAAKETSTSKLVVHFRGHRDPSLNYLSNSRCEILPRRSEDYALISNVRHSSNKGRYGKVLQSSKLLLVGSWRWYSFIGGMKQITKCQDGRFDNWANVWNLIRARACRMTNREKNTVYKASPKALPLKFAALADRIGQVEVRVLGLMLGGCFLFTDMPAPTAEQLHGKIVINSMNPQRLSFGAQAIAFICKAPTHTFQQTRKMFEKAFRTRLEDIFEEFSEEPVASGSIAQVHKAILKHKLINGYAGQVVAVKVQTA
ncbi:hypothetical protein Mp_Vg00950 [Marchantia polymorpha subsp. ruderalis]|uniref:ABC1 atypical kinase-like domain-containing protein n=1 Tax=Marchantia polymorpha TaxID=3197 RepID=A0A2R6VX35_MARPO|nr:hypothetical protein MARPO_YA0027 [Marchantia polymorpha]BBN20612.1 hypothetical protein Mp_Vg00950 [Marchantia polymorpha subsp. ruderalis]|eukprot:PTQ26160.1 hypothetical protein MARPO_YA0027 [Marchantia polymorpha]